jgi:prevent-host-death family protein
MAEVGIRALKQNASAVVAQAASGEPVTITDRGRAVAQLVPLPASRLDMLLAAGLARPPRRNIGTLGPPSSTGDLSAELRRIRDDERY